MIQYPSTPSSAAIASTTHFSYLHTVGAHGDEFQTRMAARLLQLALLLAPSLCICSAASASSSYWSSSSGSQQCARDHTALTSDCLGLCYDGRPCIAYAADAVVAIDGEEGEEAASCEPTAFSACVNATDGGGCALECFTNGPDDFVAREAVGFSSYTFLIPFAGDEEAEAAEENDTDALPSKTNDVLKRIEPLSLLSVTTKVYERRRLLSLQQWGMASFTERIDDGVYIVQRDYRRRERGGRRRARENGQDARGRRIPGLQRAATGHVRAAEPTMREEMVADNVMRWILPRAARWPTSRCERSTAAPCRRPT